MKRTTKRTKKCNNKEPENLFALYLYHSPRVMQIAKYRRRKEGSFAYNPKRQFIAPRWSHRARLDSFFFRVSNTYSADHISFVTRPPPRHPSISVRFLFKERSPPHLPAFFFPLLPRPLPLKASHSGPSGDHPPAFLLWLPFTYLPVLCFPS